MKLKLDKDAALKKLKGIGLILATGVILALPFMNYSWGWLVCVCPMALLFYLEHLEAREQSIRNKVLSVWALGAVFFGVNMNWLYHIHAADLIQNGLLRNFFIFITFFAVVAVLASGFALFAWLYFRLSLSQKSATAFFYIPVLWALSEFGRSVIFSIVWLGPGGSVGAHWNFGVLGFAASASPVAFGARLVGLFGLSILVVVINLALYNLVRRRQTWLALTSLGVCFLVVVAGWLAYRNPVNPQSRVIGLVHLKSDQDSGYEADLESSVKSRYHPKVDLLVLPEYSHFLEDQADLPSQADIVKATVKPTSAAAILTSRSEAINGEHSNAVVVLDRVGTVQASQFKRFLIPGGEYIPYVYQILLALSGNTTVISDHTQNRAVEKATKVEKPLVLGGVHYGVLACSGAIAPDFYRNLARTGAGTLVNTASLSSMGIEKLYFGQARQMSRFIAVANARDFAQSARGGQSYIVSKNGKFTIASQGDTTQYLTGAVSANSRRTLYTICGEWLLAVCAVILISLTIAQKKANLKRKRKHGQKNSHKSQKAKK